MPAGQLGLSFWGGRFQCHRGLLGGHGVPPRENCRYGLIVAGAALFEAAGVTGVAALGERCVGASGVLLSGNWPLYLSASSIRSVPSFPSLLIRMPFLFTVTSARPETCCIKLPMKLCCVRFEHGFGAGFSGIGAPMIFN